MIRKLTAAVEQSSSTVVITNREGVIEYVNPRFSELTGYSAADAIGQKPSILKSGKTPPEIYVELWQTIISGEAWRGELQNRKKSGELYWESITISPIRDDAGIITHFLAIEEDITLRKRGQELQQVLLDELDHRVKNILATVLSIAHQSSRHASTIDQFRDAFTGRLMALAGAHQLLTRSRWNGVLLCDLLELATRPYQSRGHERSVVARGRPVILAAHIAQAFSLVLHELTTNAVKYGALSVPEGQVEIDWEIAEEAGERRLLFEWCERGGPAVSPPKEHGFGAALLERLVTYEIGGTAELDFSDECGFRCRITVPLDDKRPVAEYYQSGES